MADLAGWIALVATSIAALMTAANLGTRVTGWGFVIFTVSAAAWIVVGVSTHQTQLLWSNAFLAVVDLFGVWRWLALRSWFSDTAEAEEERSETDTGEDLFTLSALDGMPVKDAAGKTIAKAVEALAARGAGTIAYVIIREGGLGGVGETLRRLPWQSVRVEDRSLLTNLDGEALRKLPKAGACPS